MSTEKNTSKLVVKSNKVIEARYKLDLLEQKLLTYVIAEIRKDDQNFKIFQVKVNELAKFLGIDSKDIYSKMKAITRKLLKRELVIKDEGSELQLTWISSAEYLEGKGIVEIEFSEKLQPFFLQLKKQFTKYELKNIVKFRSTYALRFYELLKQYEDIGKRIFDIDVLRELLGIEEGQYLKYSAFKKYVLMQAKAEIEKQTDIEFNFKEIKKGRRICALEFIIFQNKQQKLLMIDTPNNSPNHDDSDQKNEMVDRLINCGLSNKQALEFVIQYPLARIERNIQYAVKTDKFRKIKNFKGYLFSAIEEDYALTHVSSD